MDKDELEQRRESHSAESLERGDRFGVTRRREATWEVAQWLLSEPISGMSCVVAVTADLCTGEHSSKYLCVALSVHLSITYLSII